MLADMFTYEIDERVSLRLIEPGDADEFFRLVQRNFDRLRVWCPWIDRVGDVEATADFLKEKIERFAAGNGFTSGILVDGCLSGVIALEHIDRANFATEIGYWIDSASEGRGIVMRSCEALIEYAFRDLKLRRVQIRCADGNHRSRAIPERLGFREEGTIRQCERLHDRYVDLVIYGILDEEWNALRSS